MPARSSWFFLTIRKNLLSKEIHVLTHINYWAFALISGNATTTMTKIIALISATLLRVNSIDFLLPYSFVPPAPPIPNPSQPFGLINKMDTIHTIPTIIIIHMSTAFIYFTITIKLSYYLDHTYCLQVFNLKLYAYYRW